MFLDDKADEFPHSTLVTKSRMNSDATIKSQNPVVSENFEGKPKLYLVGAVVLASLGLGIALTLRGSRKDEQ